MLQVVMAARPAVLLFEAANPRHAHEVDVFRKLKDQIPDNKVSVGGLENGPVTPSTQVLVPGVIDSTTNFIEHPALVAR